MSKTEVLGSRVSPRDVKAELRGLSFHLQENISELPVSFVEKGSVVSAVEVGKFVVSQLNALVAS